MEKMMAAMNATKESTDPDESDEMRSIQGYHVERRRGFGQSVGEPLFMTTFIASFFLLRFSGATIANNQAIV